MNGSNGSLLCAVRGPIVLVAVGVLFTLHQFTPYSFTRTWPVLLILVGLLKLFERLVARSGGGA